MVEGWLEELGITLNYNSFISGPAMMEANADWDLAACGGPGVLNGLLNYDVTAIGIVENEKILNLYVREDSPLVASGKGHVEGYPETYGTAEDWKGTEWLIPVGTTMHMTLVTVLEQLGLTADDVIMTNMDATTALTAFRAGEGDGLAVWTTTAIEAENDNAYIQVASAADNDVTVSAGMVATNEALADSHKREAIQKLWELYYITAEWIQDNLDEASVLFAETCAIEGITATEDVELARECYTRVPDVTLQESFDTMLTTAPDAQGLADREINGGERDIFYTLDFFIAQEKYEMSQREYILENNKISSEIAQEVYDIIEARQVEEQ